MGNDYDKDYNEVMDLLMTVDGVKEHLESEGVKKFKEDTLKKLELLNEIVADEGKRRKINE